ncbi:MAG TPA: transcription antitermination factor NusB, partial [Trueperaceae bacterium]|nr:transcription antitermination factor NusB [Trueperaceae bacterium]
MTDRARPGPARLAALDVVVRTVAGEFLAPTLRSVLDASGLEGMQRSQVTDLAYGALRRLQQIDARLAPGLKQPAKLPPRVLAALRLGVFELLYRHTPAHAAVSEWVEVVKYEASGLAPLANAVLRGVERRASQERRESDTGPLTVGAVDPLTHLSLPSWLWQELVASLGAAAAYEAAQGMLEPEPLWLTAFTADAAVSLVADGCEVAPLSTGRPASVAGAATGPENGPASGRDVGSDAGPDTAGVSYPLTLRVRSPMPLDRLNAYRDGLVQPQNPTSLHAALALGSGPGQVVYDLASGRGIKSAVLAATGAHVTGVELVKRRTRAALTNLARLHLTVAHVAADLVAPAPEALLAAIAEANGWQEPRLADAVLLDAPCSGTGTLRGHPEIKLRLSPTDVVELAAVQAAMLSNAAALVAP